MTAQLDPDPNTIAGILLAVSRKHFPSWLWDNCVCGESDNSGLHLYHQYELAIQAALLDGSIPPESWATDSQTLQKIANRFGNAAVNKRIEEAIAFDAAIQKRRGENV